MRGSFIYWATYISPYTRRSYSLLNIPRVTAAPVLPVGYVVSARRIADRRMILAGYRLADLLRRVVGGSRRFWEKVYRDLPEGITVSKAEEIGAFS